VAHQKAATRKFIEEGVMAMAWNVDKPMEPFEACPECQQRDAVTMRGKGQHGRRLLECVRCPGTTWEERIPLIKLNPAVPVLRLGSTRMVRPRKKARRAKRRRHANR
jgi:ssDNA-binding Zn-finger/Zn-ribbon topoisomerase 1